MKRTALLVCCLLALTMPLPSTAQVSGAAVSMTCPDTVDVNDPLGNTTTTYQCTVSNPTAYEENISFEVQSENLQALTTTYLIVPAGGEESVDVHVTWDNADADDDGDGVADTTDNCPYAANEGQEDSDGDGIGDACDAEDGETPSVPSLGFVVTVLTFLGAAAYLRRD